MLSKTINYRTYIYTPTQSCLNIEISASTHDQPDVIASEPFCLGPDNTIVRRKRQIVRQRREIQHELFSFPLARTTSCVQKKTRERTEPALYVCYETPSAQREPPLANWKQPVKQSNQALATAVALNFVYGLSVASKAT
jgi:hypothetical protein